MVSACVHVVKFLYVRLAGDANAATDTHDEGDVLRLEKVNDVFCPCEPSVKDEQG